MKNSSFKINWLAVITCNLLTFRYIVGRILRGQLFLVTFEKGGRRRSCRNTTILMGTSRLNNVRITLYRFLYTSMLLANCVLLHSAFLPVTFAICQVASPELPTESTALHTTVSIQIVGVDLTLNVNSSVLL